MTGGVEPAGVEVRDLTVAFGNVVAVDGLNLTVPRGATMALLGRNGAGKSTTMRVLGGVVPPSAGSVHIAGTDAVAAPLQARHLLGYCPDVGGTIPRATPWEHLQLAARLRRMGPGWESRAESLLDRFDLLAEADRMTAGFSHGMNRRLSVVLAAFHCPPVLLLDEPFDGVDPVGVEATQQVIRDAQAGGAAIIVSTHLLPLAMQACTTAVVLRGGRCVASEPADRFDGESGRAYYRDLVALPAANGSAPTSSHTAGQVTSGRGEEW